MPYIKQDARHEFAFNENRWAKTPGDLNYVCTMALGMYGPGEPADTIIKEFIKHYIDFKGVSYQTYNDIMGVLTCMICEITRRIGLVPEVVNYLSKIATDFYKDTVVPYEELKIKENGDLEVFQMKGV